MKNNNNNIYISYVYVYVYTTQHARLRNSFIQFDSIQQVQFVLLSYSSQINGRIVRENDTTIIALYPHFFLFSIEILCENLIHSFRLQVLVSVTD